MDTVILILLLCSVLLVLKMLHWPRSQNTSDPLSPIPRSEPRVPRQSGSGDTISPANSDATPRAPASPKTPLRHEPTAAGLPELPTSDFVIIDLETTGLDPSVHQITQIAAYRATAVCDVGEGNGHAHFTVDGTSFSTYCRLRPYSRVPRRITELTGITGKKLREEGKPLDQALRQLLAHIGDAPVICHNAAFDTAFLRHACAEHGLTFNNSTLCTLALARTTWPHLPLHSLAHLAEAFNLRVDKAHDAMSDVITTLGLYCTLLRMHGALKPDPPPDS